MNKNEMVHALSEKANVSVADAGRVLEAFMETVVDTCAKGEEIRFVGFGSFVMRDMAAREARNPQTGAMIKIPARRVVRFVPGKKFKDAVAK